MKLLLILACLMLPTFIHGTSAQTRQNDKSLPAIAPSSQGDQVESKTDRFSNVTIIRLKPQVLLEKPGHLITMSLDAKFGGKVATDQAGQAAEILAEKAFVRFESQASINTDFGDKQLHFVIDGKPMNVGESAGTLVKLTGKDPDLKPGFKYRELFTNTLDLNRLKAIANGKRVEMRLGNYQFELSPEVLSNIRAFTTECTRYAASGKLKGRQP